VKKTATTMAFLALLSAAKPARACGWYLMTPPNPPQIPGAGVPTTSHNGWTNEESFDSAAQCKQNLAARQERAERMYQRVEAARPPNVDNLFAAGRTLWGAADCVASDDPRLGR
jgi:hypothetical protein